MNLLSKFCGFLFLAMLIGCAGTTVPKPAKDTVASWDGTNQNSGFIGFTSDGSGIITAHARDRYNGLAARYSNQFIPPLKLDDGLKPMGTNWLIDPEHLVKFRTMNRWRKSGI